MHLYRNNSKMKFYEKLKILTLKKQIFGIGKAMTFLAKSMLVTDFGDSLGLCHVLFGD